MLKEKLTKQIFSGFYSEEQVHMVSEVNFNSAIINSSIANQSRSVSEGSRADVQTSAANSVTESYAANMAANTGADAAIEQALEDAGLLKSERNINTARQMLQNQMPLNRDNLRNIMTQVSMYREADASSIIMMNKYGMPVTRFTAAQFQAYLNNEQQLTSQFNTAVDSMLELISTGSAEAAAFNAELLDLLTEGGLRAYNEGPAGEMNAAQAEAAATDGALLLAEQGGEMGAEEVFSGAQGAVAAGLSGSNISAEAALANGVNAAAQGLVYGTTNEIQTEVDGSGTDVFNGFDSDNGGLGEAGVKSGESGAEQAGHGLQTNESFSGLVNDRLTLSSVFTEAELNHLEGLKQLLGKSGENPGASTISEALKELRENLLNSSDQELENLLKSPLYQKLIRHAVSNKLSMAPENLQDADSINDYYKETYSALSKLHEAAAANEKLSEALSKPMDNLKFMDTLNNLFPYIQLPLTLREGKTHGELYVFKNGRSKSGPGDTQSVLLHLDMDNLGPTDIHLELKNRNLRLRFYADTEPSLNALSGSFGELSSALEAKNYRIQSEFELRDENKNVLTEVLERDKSEGPAFQYSFDIRA